MLNSIQQKEFKKLKPSIKEDLDGLIEKYIRIMSWDVPENDEEESKKAIIKFLKETIKEEYKEI